MTGAPATRKYVRGACDRCRRQKLKCDVRRPCTMCERAKVDCIGRHARNPKRTAAAQMARQSPRNSTNVLSEQDPRANTSPKPRQAPGNEPRASDAVVQAEDRNDRVQQNLTTDCNDDRRHEEGAPELTSSATAALVETALLYNTDTSPTNHWSVPAPEMQNFNSSSIYGAGSAATMNMGETYTPEAINGPVQRGKHPRRPTNARLQERLLSVLPGLEATKLLVDTYFDRAHWFMLVFHQQAFRRRLQCLHDTPESFRTRDKSSAGFLAVLLTVVCIALQYLGPYRKSLLRAHGVEKEELQNSIVLVLEESFLAIVSLGSLETVQSCVLLGTFYLYHSDPTTAWSICGCAVRVAQALKLHRKWPARQTGDLETTTEILRHIEARKRCWWALYEVETFCCMLYGYACNTTMDAECDLDYVGSELEVATGVSQDPDQRPPFSLLAYKGKMSELSVIIKSALVELYGHWTVSQGKSVQDLRPEEKRRRLLQSLESLDGRLSKWFAELPSQLQAHTGCARSYEDIEESNKDLGGSGELFDNNIIRLQALALKLAYENAKILVHRPLLAYKLDRVRLQNPPNDSSHILQARFADQYQKSLVACRHAALQTADVGNSPAFPFALQSYAAAFMSTHFFTAGVTLCLSAIIEPLTEHASQAKRGLQQLFSLQNDPVAEPLTSPHVMDVLEKLIRLVLKRELANILEPVHRNFQRRTIGLRPVPEFSVRQAGMNICQQEDMGSHSTSHASHVPSPTLQQAEQVDDTYEHSEATSHQTFGNGLHTSAEALEGFENVLSSLSTDQARSGLGSFDDGFFSAGNDPLAFDQEQAWMWDMDSLSQLWGA